MKTPKEMALMCHDIGEHLVTDEDKLIWTAGAAVASTMQIVPWFFKGCLEENNRWMEILHPQAATGEVHLPQEYKDHIINWVRVCFSPEVTKICRERTEFIFREATAMLI